jgi:hypothetical protein
MRSVVVKGCSAVLCICILMNASTVNCSSITFLHDACSHCGGYDCMSFIILRSLPDCNCVPHIPGFEHSPHSIRSQGGLSPLPPLLYLLFNADTLILSIIFCCKCIECACCTNYFLFCLCTYTVNAFSKLMRIFCVVHD